MSSFVRLLVVALTLPLAVVACGGASSNEVSSARSAHYTGDKMTLFKALADTVQGKYPIDKVDNQGLILETVGRWYTPEGLSVSERMDDIRDVPDRSVHVAFIVALVADGNAFVVDIKERVFRYDRNSPKPQPLKEDDISIPGFVHGKHDAFAVDVHDALKGFEVSGTPAAGAPGSAAPPATPPPATPATPPAPAPQ